MTIKAGNIRKGMYLLFKDAPHLVTKTDFMSPGKGSAFMRTRLKNIRNGNTQEFTYKSTESVEEVEIVTARMQFLYADADSAVFMNQDTFEQAEVPVSLLGNKVSLLTADVLVYLMSYDDVVIDVSLPAKIALKVTYAEDAVAGNTMGTARKNVTLETGLVIPAPLFVKEGETILVDTESMSYDSRAS